MKKLLFTLGAIMLFAVSCEKSSMQDMQPAPSASNETGRPADITVNSFDRIHSNLSMVSVYFNGAFYSARVKELTATEIGNVLNQPDETIKTIFVAPTLAVLNGVDFWFYPVLDNLTNTSTSVLYYEKQIRYDSRITVPYQFTSSTDIWNAVARQGSGISVLATGKYVMVTILTKSNPNE